ncbi:hypothetical protein EDD85DRAFT_795617 [Armillaria nabsnona]|nr:hypothetical protein EDD85DRAFT_795617 [Armillaria nabsnona]
MPSPAVDGLSNATATRAQVTNTSSRWCYAILMAIPFLRVNNDAGKVYKEALICAPERCMWSIEAQPSGNPGFRLIILMDCCGVLIVHLAGKRVLGVLSRLSTGTGNTRFGFVRTSRSFEASHPVTRQYWCWHYVGLPKSGFVLCVAKIFPSDRGADFDYVCKLQDGSTLSNLPAVCAGDTTCYVLRVMPGLCSLFAGDKMAGTGNGGFGFAVDYRFLPWWIPLANLIGERGRMRELAIWLRRLQR